MTNVIDLEWMIEWYDRFWMIDLTEYVWVILNDG